MSIDIDNSVRSMLEQLFVQLRREYAVIAQQVVEDALANITGGEASVDPGALPFDSDDPADAVFGAAGIGAPGDSDQLSHSNHVHRINPTVGGDLSGSLPNPVVAKIQGIPVSTTDPTDGQVLVYNLSTLQYIPASPSAVVSPGTIISKIVTNGDPNFPEIVFDGNGEVVWAE